MTKNLIKMALVIVGISSNFAFANSDNPSMNILMETFKQAKQPTAEFLTSSSYWECIESRSNGTSEFREYQVSNMGSIVFVQNVEDFDDSYSFVEDKNSKSFTATNPHSGVQLFARETSNGGVLIEMTSKDGPLGSPSSMSHWLRFAGYISCTLQ
jgi:hypothetical protein